MNKPLILSAFYLSAVLAGCANLEPQVPQAQAEIPEQWPLAQPDQSADSPLARVADLGWRDFFVDARLQTLIEQALKNNRDLRVALLNVERARALYRIQRADRLPSFGLSAQASRNGGDVASRDIATVSLGLAQFELDLFGRVRNLSAAAMQSYLATEEVSRVAQLALIAEVANAWLQLATDSESQRIAQATLENYQAAFKLSEQRHALGAVSGLDVSQSATLVEAARVDLARFSGRVETDRNALALLIGGPFDPQLLPKQFEPQISGVQPLPAGLASSVLLRRPDIRAAEHRLLAANANIGAARAAFFPSISLTGSVGSASEELGGLFDSASRSWSFLPRINVPIFQGGRLRAGLEVATADRDIALARYEQAIQAGFREVADTLALSRTLAAQREAQEALLAAAIRVHELSDARYRAGQDSYLLLLDAQRTLFSARLALVSTQQAEQANRVLLYRALGGGLDGGVGGNLREQSQ